MLFRSLIDQYPYKDQILKGANHSGSGARPGANGSNGGAGTMPRSEFNKLSPLDQRARVTGKDAVRIVD